MFQADNLIKSLVSDHCSDKIKAILVASNITDEIISTIKQLKIGRTYSVICDDNTHDILAKHLADKLSDTTIFNLGKPYADSKTVEKVQNATKNSDIIIAVGSGTINDICKLASFLSDKPYIICATAASMNGYCSANASISYNGHKKTVTAHLPTALFFDLNVIASAPSRLTKSGVGDLLCRSTAQCDWLLSHLALGTDYNKQPFNLLAEYENQLFSNASSLLKNDLEIFKLLVNSLIVSGLGMYISGGSYPASQGEHMIAHTMEMKYNIKGNYHGEEIAVTTLHMAKIQEEILPVIKERLNKLATDYNRQDIIDFFGEDIGKQCISEYEKKLDNINHNLQISNIESKIAKHHMSHNKIFKILRSIDAPVYAKDINWDENKLTNAIKHAKYTRDRFTFLDL